MNRNPLALLSLSLCLTACDRAAPTTQPRRPATEDARSIDLRNSDRASDMLEGDVLIQTVRGNNAIVVALDGGRPPALPDGVADQIFVLQREGAGTVEGRLKLARARLLYEGKSLLIDPRDGSAPMQLSVDANASLSGRGRAFLRRALVRDRLIGYGLSRRTGQWALNGTYFSPAALTTLIPACRQAKGGTAGGPARSFGLDNICDSGGVGSTGCSTSCPGGGSCSTNCGSGYHSCCDSGRCACTCVAN